MKGKGVYGPGMAWPSQSQFGWSPHKMMALTHMNSQVIWTR